MSTERDRAIEIATALKQRVDNKLGDIWWALLSRGILAIGVAVCAFVWPQQTVGILIKLLGVYFLFDGVIAAIWLYRSGRTTSKLMQISVSLAIGLLLLFWTGVSAKLFLIFVGTWLVLQGIGLFLASLSSDIGSGVRSLMRGLGVIMMIIGVVFVLWTETGIVAISWLIGFTALLLGVLLVLLATWIKTLRTQMDHLGERS